MQCIGRGLTSLGKKSTGVIHAQPPPPLRLWDDRFLHSHIYLESNNSLPLASCWSLSSIVQDLHYSTGNRWQVQRLERCISHSAPPSLACSGLEVGPSTQLHPWELREVGEQRQRNSSPSIKGYRLLCPAICCWPCPHTCPSHTVCTQTWQ